MNQVYVSLYITVHLQYREHTPLVDVVIVFVGEPDKLGKESNPQSPQ